MFRSDNRTSKRARWISLRASDTDAAVFTSNPCSCKTGGSVSRMLGSSSTKRMRLREGIPSRYRNAGKANHTPAICLISVGLCTFNAKFTRIVRCRTLLLANRRKFVAQPGPREDRWPEIRDGRGQCNAVTLVEKVLNGSVGYQPAWKLASGEYVSHVVTIQLQRVLVIVILSAGVTALNAEHEPRWPPISSLPSE